MYIRWIEYLYLNQIIYLYKGKKGEGGWVENNIDNGWYKVNFFNGKKYNSKKEI